MSEYNIKLSIIILNYNTPKLVKYLLTNFFDLKKNFSYEVIVINNGEKTKFLEEIRAFRNSIKVREIPNHGYAAGNNTGMRAASGEYVMIMNPDLYWHDGEIEKMIDYLDQHTEVGILGPKLIYPSQEVQYSCLRYPDWHLPFYRRSKLSQTTRAQKWLDHYLLKDYNHQTARAVDWLFGACLLVRQRAIAQVGLLDEQYFMYFEDLDWCRRFNNASWQVHYLPTAQVIHFHHRDSADKIGFFGFFTKLGRIHFYSWLKYLRKWNFS
ncbi:MAG: hypothetical protein COX77_03925 [Candidatus Komeilibacteria bacterium CG_4_10_14_0_2_um_filter_37_10]|uniref:Glycosyltransferase 2-like domain-containing protein n=1 Tax=Candidatus Komeilibacteria bacterium CG_4_10_14_0_2_um_filter_37_10 TaxID=1974470 RepID=A0A2M7VEA6_9BACT|nr:MAG: hypothetical protein COX77_03925 [Candidatus Komeilibacteria bacterium CG_4_10_14_0_2_um_filter_37_10]